VDRSSSIYVAGHTGLVGAGLVRHLRDENYDHLVLRTHDELDLMDREAVFGFFEEARPEYVIIAAAKVGGIAANIAAPVDFLVQNLRIQTNLLEACQRWAVKKTVFLGSSCIYPRDAPQPMQESAYMHGPVEPTNESYAIAKIAGIRHAQALWEQYKVPVLLPMPSNVYGPGDHFDLKRAHVVSALVKRFADARAAEASAVQLWGTGNARRELLHVDDLAEAVLFLMDRYERPDIINVGTGSDITIRDLAELVADIVGYGGRIEWDTTKPDGMPQKLLDVARIHSIGWHHRIELREGIETVLADYRATSAES
jgi:GDP-L-fucose synthase